MSILSKVSIKLSLVIFLAVSTLLILTFPSQGFYKSGKINQTRFDFHIDTVPRTADTIGRIRDTVSTKVVKLDTLKISKDSVDAPISWEAEDSAVALIPEKQFILYGKSKTKYTDVELEAGVIRYDYVSNTVAAFGNTDTSNSLKSKPILRQGGTESINDSIFFNLKSKKGLTKNSFYQEGEMFVYASRLKKLDDEVLFGEQGRFTTCNLDEPHFAFRTKKMKLVSKKLAITGPAFPEFEGIPIPVGIPFGIYPLSRGRQSGILAPQFTTNEDFGIGLEGLGYYKVLSDYIDITVRSSLYTYGGWNLNINPRYQKRYKYSGGLNIAIQKSKILNRSAAQIKDEFIQNSSFMINWNHTRDNRARPGTNFSANVNAGSTKFNTFAANNPFINFQNQLNSSIQYTKDWNGKVNLALTANHNQNNTTGLVNLNLPSANVNVVTFYPFERKEQVGTQKWYEKLGISYSGNIQNQVSFYDSAVNLRKLLDTVQWGAQHNIPISLSLPSLGPITIAPSITYQERWYGQSLLRSWNATRKKVDTVIQKGFYTAREMSFGVGASTRIFGTVQFKKGNLKAIRHEVRPNFSLNYKPDLVKQYYKTVQVDTTGRTLRFSQFDGGILGSYAEGKFGGVSFGVDNLLEMKVRDKNDTSATATKKVRLIDGFGFNSSYNLMADSFALAPFTFYLRSTLFEKLNITAGFTMDPYDIDAKGYRINNLLWNAAKFKLGRITGGNIAVSTSFSSKPRDDRKTSERLPADNFMTPEEQMNQLNFVRQNPAEFTDFNIPWTLNLQFAYTFFRVQKPDFSGFVTNSTANLNLDGDFSLSPKWKIGGNTYLNFESKKIEQLSLFISREMHCWQMSINVIPVGLYRSFNISLSPKSGILRDLRINRSRTFSNL